jgi:hypothetical protein
MAADRKPGSAKGQVRIAPDFDAALQMTSDLAVSATQAEEPKEMKECHLTAEEQIEVVRQAELAEKLIKASIYETAPVTVTISEGRVVKVHFGTGVHRKLLRAFLHLAMSELSTNPHMSSRGFIATERSLADLAGIAVEGRTEVVEIVAALQRNPVEWLVYDSNSRLTEKRRFAAIQEARFLDGGRIRFFLAPTLMEVLQLSLISSEA